MQTDGTTIDPFVQSFVRQLRSHPWLDRAVFYYGCERNTGMEAMRHASALRNEFNVKHLMENPERGPGLWTSPTSKYEYGEYLRGALNRRSLLWLNDFICLQGNTDRRRDEIRQKAYEELNNVQKIVKSSSDDMRPPRIGWSGKFGYDGKVVEGQNDDMVIVIGICCREARRITVDGRANVWTGPL